jgi:hypothetical protein
MGAVADDGQHRIDRQHAGEAERDDGEAEEGEGQRTDQSQYMPRNRR